MKTLFALLLLGVCAPAWAQGVYKCRNAAGKITYSSLECESQGMKDAGEIKDSLQVTPAPPAPKVPATPSTSRTTAPKASAPKADAPKEEAKKTVPQRRCFKTPKGYRCNDVPDEKSDKPE